MLDVAAVVGVLALLSLVVGLPAAFAVRERSEGWTALVIDGLLYGFALGSLAVVLWAWIGVPGVVIAALVIAALVVVAVRRRAGLPLRPRLVRADLILAALWIVLLVVAMVLRFHNVNFLMWTGDMGAYVNWSNEFVRTGEFHASWPPLFPAFLSVATALFGPAATTAGVPLTGLLLILALARVLSRFGVERWITFGISVLVVFSVHATWYSSFPSSESLNAPLVLVWLGTLLGLMRSTGLQFATYASLSFASMLALGMLRSTGPALLIPVAIVAIFAFIIPQWRKYATALTTTVVAGAAAGIIVYWYGITQIYKYFVEMQITSLVPGVVSSALKRLGLFAPTIVTALVLVLGVAVIAVVAWWANRRWPQAVEVSEAADTRGARIARRFAFIVGGLLIVGVALDGVVRAEVFAILFRLGPWLPILAFAAFFLPRIVKVPSERLVIMLVLGLTSGMFIALHTVRLKIFRDHSFFIYWDRYVVSEIYPALLVVLGLGASTAWALWLAPRYRAWRENGAERTPTRRRLVAAAPALIAGALVLAITLPSAPLLAKVTSDTYMAGNYEFQQRVAGLVPSTDDAIYWSSTTGDQLDDFFFPNTWMAFAVPLRRTQGYEVLNARQGANNFRPDDVATADALVALAACRPDKTLIVLETDAGGENLEARLAEQLDPGTYEISHLGREVSSISLLAQPPTAGWTRARIAVDGWRVDLTAAQTSSISCDN